jgi:hypothetical protein
LLIISLPAGAADDTLKKEDVNSILNNFVYSDKDSELYNKLNTYLKETTMFDSEEYQMTVKEFGLAYYDSISNLSDCIKEMDIKRTDVSNYWLNDFNRIIDKNYSLKQMENIKFILFAVSSVNNMKYCEEHIKNALYNEIQYREIIADYLRYLQHFSETLDNKNRRKITDRIAVVNSFLEGPPYPLQVLLSHEKGSLFAIALKTRRDLDKGLVSFFSTHPFFRKPFDPMKAFKELEAPAHPIVSD